MNKAHVWVIEYLCESGLWRPDPLEVFCTRRVARIYMRGRNVDAQYFRIRKYVRAA